MQVIEKSVTDTQKSASSDVSETVVQRLTPNGLQPVEKQSQVVSKQGNGGYQAESTTYRSDGNGGFAPALRQTTEHIVQGSQVSDNSAEYERDSYGQLSLHGQTVTKTVTGPDGFKQMRWSISIRRNVPGTVGFRQRVGTKAAGTTNDREPAGAGQHGGSNPEASAGRPFRGSRNAGAAAPAFSKRCARAIASRPKRLTNECPIKYG